MASDDFDDFCTRASDLARRSDGAPLFTVTQSLNKSKQNDALTSEGGNSVMTISETLFLENESMATVPSGEDDWEFVAGP